MSDLITSANHPKGWYPHAGWYLRNWKAAKAALATRETIRIKWPGNYFAEDMTAEQFSRWIRRGLDHQINAKGGIEPKGRKYTDQYQTNLSRDARQINRIGTERLRVYATEITTPGFRRRFAHLFASHDD